MLRSSLTAVANLDSAITTADLLSDRLSADLVSAVHPPYTPMAQARALEGGAALALAGRRNKQPKKKPRLCVQREGGAS